MAIITLAHNLRLKVIAEGIETEDQFAFLRLLRCDEGQGYFLGPPSEANKLFAPYLNRDYEKPQTLARAQTAAGNLSAVV